MTLAPGHYKARALDADFGFAGTGTKQVALSFEILDGDERGEHISWYGFFTQNTAERTVESLRHCGCVFPDDRLDDLNGLGNTEVELVVEEETSERGEAKSRVRWVNRLGGGVALGSRMDEVEKRALSDEMRGYVVASRPAGTSAPAASTAARATSTAGQGATPAARPVAARGGQHTPAPNEPPTARRPPSRGDDAPPY